MTVPLPDLLWVLGLGMLGWVLAALMVGLFLGERGRRRAAERMVTYGTPDETRTTAVSRRPAKEVEDRFAEAAREFSPEQIETVVKDLKKQAAAQGIEGITDEQFEEDAKMLLAGQDVMA